MWTCPTCQNPLDDALRVCPVDGTALGPADPLIGRVLGDRYRVLAQIGEGGMGTVYRVEHVVLGRKMAVKVLRPEYSTDDDLVRRFQREAVAASRIGQENIVDVTDFGRTREGNLYFVMEELEGRSLANVIHAEGPVPFDRAALILAQVCRALAAAHSHGIVHRDLKPDNVLVMRRADGSDFVKVVDFGISKSPGEGEERLTRAGTIIGTPEYMSPEQGAAASIDHRADVYAFGILAYEVLTGTVPFQGETSVATLIEHQTRPPEPPSRRRPGIPAEFEQLILKALEKKPPNRQQSMVEVAEDLSRVLARYHLPPVYERGRTPPPRPAPMSGYTVRLHRQSRSARGETIDIGDTVERLPPPSGKMAQPRELPALAAEQRRAGRRAGRRVAVGVALAALLAASAAAWISYRSPRLAPPGVAPAADAAVQQASLAPPAVPAASVAPPAAPAPAPEPQASAPAPLPDPPAEAARARPRAVAGARPPAPKPSPPAKPRREVGARPGSEENPYGKLDDLKPDPF
jgi:serine/threonine-protein kinase